MESMRIIEDFNWDAYENSEALSSISAEELEKAYDGIINTVKKDEIVEVNNSYGRNVLIAKGLGIEANAKTLNDLKLKKQNDDKIVAKLHCLIDVMKHHNYRHAVFSI